MSRPRNALNVTEAERERIREMYRQGVRLTDICRRTGRSDSVVSRAVRGLRRPKPRPTGSPKVAQRNRLIAQRFREGVPQGVLARRFHLSPTMVCEIVRRALGQRKKRRSQARSSKRSPPKRPRESRVGSKPWSELTTAQRSARERYVLERVEKGASINSVARRYGMSPATAARIVERVRARQEKRTREIVRLVVQEGVARAVVARRFGMSARRVAAIVEDAGSGAGGR